MSSQLSLMPCRHRGLSSQLYHLISFVSRSVFETDHLFHNMKLTEQMSEIGVPDGMLEYGSNFHTVDTSKMSSPTPESLWYIFCCVNNHSTEKAYRLKLSGEIHSLCPQCGGATFLKLRQGKSQTQNWRLRTESLGHWVFLSCFAGSWFWIADAY
jgi:hypothetical protein